MFAGLGIVGRGVTPDAVFGTAVADKYQASRRPRDGVIARPIDGIDFPDEASGFRLQRDQSPVEAADVDFALINGDAPVDHAQHAFRPQSRGTFGS